IVSTPSAYAREILADGRGLLVPVKNAEAIRLAAGSLLRDPEFRSYMKWRAYSYGHKMIWSNVARAYAVLFQQLAREAPQTVRTFVAAPGTPARSEVAEPRLRVS
ncbi:MAG: glycosyl transferase family 1, partial [Chloroflexota bacterium]|nr:glycosyl transferase family 1 [Chloroflexota bacterium]